MFILESKICWRFSFFSTFTWMLQTWHNSYGMNSFRALYKDSPKAQEDGTILIHMIIKQTLTLRPTWVVYKLVAKIGIW